MDTDKTLFYLTPVNSYALEIIQHPDNSNRACQYPKDPKTLCLRIGLDQESKSPPYLVSFGRRDYNDVILNRYFPRIDQCYFDFNKESGEILLHDISRDCDTQLTEIRKINNEDEDENGDEDFKEELGIPLISEGRRQCVVLLGPDSYHDRMEWLFQIRHAKFRLIPGPTQPIEERLAFARNTNDDGTPERDLQQRGTLDLQPTGSLFGNSPNHRLNNASTLLPSVEAASDDVYPLSNSNNLNDNVHPADNPQNEERDMYSASVLGREMLVPRTYDPDTYDFDARMPWTPEPEPYDSETYSAWGRKHFGEEWYQLRKVMLEERNPHDKDEPVYIGRQQALRVIEHQAEGRPFRPYSQGDDLGDDLVGDLGDEGWKRLWARMSNNQLGLPRSPSPPPAPSTPPSDRPELRKLLIPGDPWERIEYMREHRDLTEENYHFQRFFLREEIIDRARRRREDGPGNRQAREKRELMKSFYARDLDRFHLEKDNIRDHINLPKKGWTREEIVAVYEADVAFLEWSRDNPAPREFGYFSKDVTPEEEAASASYSKHDAWNCFYGSQPPERPQGRYDLYSWNFGVWDLWRKGTYGRISRRRRREALLSDDKGDAASCAEELQRIEGEEQRDREALERAIRRSTEVTDKADGTDRQLSPQDQEEIDHRSHMLNLTWFGHNYLAHKYGVNLRVKVAKLRPPPATVSKAGGTGDAPGTHMREAAAQPSATTPQPARGTLGGTEIQRTAFGGAIFGVSRPAVFPHPEGTLHKTCGGRITKDTSTQAEASPRTASQCHNRQRKTYKKERASRRLAKLEPEYGMLEYARRR
ncbi:hypothetical protein H9Q72_010273 [Fusarium xylarioides]|uniref:Uncharacterized protein n=1 Tax=Fusarium xylarioides TaxID=221167 RepID=A0A9P7L1X9_9HYPO|nr:hypothetical protein H9Q72_010273 [Fusarium xylarioides]